MTIDTDSDFCQPEISTPRKKPSCNLSFLTGYKAMFFLYCDGYRFDEYLKSADIAGYLVEYEEDGKQKKEVRKKLSGLIRLLSILSNRGVTMFEVFIY